MGRNTKEYSKEYNKKYYEKNKEKIKEYRQNNKEYRKEYNKKYREKNKEYYKEYYKKYYEKNKKNCIKYTMKYYENNKEKCVVYNKKYHKENKDKYNLTTDIWKVASKWNKLLNKNSNICNTIDFKTFYLLRKLSDVKLIRSICIRIAKGSMTAEEVNEILNEYKIEFTMEDYNLFKQYHLLGYLATNPRDGLLLKLV